MNSTGNFSFLAAHSPLLADLGSTAERLFAFDPASCVLKLLPTILDLVKKISPQFKVHPELVLSVIDVEFGARFHPFDRSVTEPSPQLSAIRTR